MSDQKSAKDVIDKFQKKQKRAPTSFIIGALALVLIFAGGVILFQWYQNPDSPMFAFLAGTSTPTATPTATETPVPPTRTPVPPTSTATETETPTITPTPTISGPFIYTVQEGDTLSSIAEQFGVDVIRIMEANELETEAIFISQQLLIPDPNEPPPSATPLPEGLPPGFLIEYRVQPEDSLIAIAIKFNSTVEAILEANEALEDENSIFVGQVIQVPVNLVTPVPTNTPGEPAPATTPGSIATLTPTSTP
jgi:LysM repeat protein